MSLLASIQSMLPRPERRSESQIEDDLDDEFAFHLEMKARELMNEGHDREAATGMARQIFGDLDRIKRKCKRIALEERIMLQRVNFIMMVVVLLMVVCVGLQVFITQRYNTLALQAITSDLARMKFETAGAEHAATQSIAAAGQVLIQGEVQKPGWYPITLEPPTFLSELLHRASVHDDQWVQYMPANQSAGTFRISPAQVFFVTNYKSILARPGDELQVYNSVSPDDRRGFYIKLWSSCYRGMTWNSANGDDPSQNWKLQLEPGNGDVFGTLRRSDGTVTLYVHLTQDFYFSDTEYRRGVLGGVNWKSEWDVEGGAFVLNLKDAKTSGRASSPDPVRDPLWPDEVRFPFDLSKFCGEASQQASTASTTNENDARVVALTNFVRQILTQADQNPSSRQVLVRELLDQSNVRIESEFADQPEVQARLREVVSEAMRKLQEQNNAGTTPAGMEPKPDSES